MRSGSGNTDATLVSAAGVIVASPAGAAGKHDRQGRNSRKFSHLASLCRGLCIVGLLLASCSTAYAQFIGYTSPQTVQQNLGTNVACTGAIQNFPVNNLGQTQHYAYITYSAQPVSALAVIQGLDLQGNSTVISDAMQGQPSTTGFSAVLVGLGYFPQVRIQITCATGPTFTVTYMGASSTSFQPLGSQIATEVDKVLVAAGPAGTNFGSQVATPPFGNSSGELFFQYSAAGPAGSSLLVQCGGSTTKTNLGTGHIQTFTFPVSTASTAQLFSVPASPCPFYNVQYTAGGASGTTFFLEYFFNAPGNTSTTTGGAGDPCQSSSTPKLSVPINILTSTTTQLVALVTGQAIYVCGISATIAPSATVADTFLVEYGTGASCGTGTTALTGAFGAGDLNTSTPPLLITFADPGTTTTAPASNALCLLTTGSTVNIQGVLTYVQQ